jgi:hypothetical protein
MTRIFFPRPPAAETKSPENELIVSGRYTVPAVAFAGIGWVATAAANMRHSRMRPQKHQMAVLGRAHIQSRAEHFVCAVFRGIHLPNFGALAKLAGSAQRVTGSARREGGAWAPGSSAHHMRRRLQV